MGKVQSKHVCRTREAPEGECLLVNSPCHMTDSSQPGSPITSCRRENWRNQQCNLVSYPVENSELSFCLTEDGKLENTIPLKVLLPPQKLSNKVVAIETDADFQTTKTLLESETDNNKQDNSNTDCLTVEEFECGVSVEGSEKQEWSFTLYDFDGRGKITKEDLASLMKSLYDAVGSSIKLPNGTKTLRLRLQVAPDTSKTNILTETKKLNNLSTMSSSLDESRKKRLSTADRGHADPDRHAKSNNLRRHLSDNRHDENHRVTSHHAKNHVTTHVTSRPSPEESQDRRNYYLDLAGIENTTPTHVKQNGLVSPTHLEKRHRTGKHRTREPGSPTEGDEEHPRSKSHDPQRSRPHRVASRPSKNRPISLPPHVNESSSPHHKRRHRHREKDRSLAMQQVAEWLEREDLLIEPETALATPGGQTTTTTTTTDLCTVQRHEHHHIHEHHHHHHYHHYHET